MTSSLVGSEMCIRDSRLFVPACQPPLPSVAVHRIDTRTNSSERLRKVAVSYTHLTLPTICSV
eukprot:5118364-Prorocentrum_lima.AAC.1